VNRIVVEEQAGFRAGRSTIDQIFVARQLSEKSFEMNRTLYDNFVDFKQAFDSVWQRVMPSSEKLWDTGANGGTASKPVQSVQSQWTRNLQIGLKSQRAYDKDAICRHICSISSWRRRCKRL